MRKRLLLAAAALLALPAAANAQSDWFSSTYRTYPGVLYRRPRRRQLAAEQPELHHGHRLDPGRQGRLRLRRSPRRVGRHVPFQHRQRRGRLSDRLRHGERQDRASLGHGQRALRFLPGSDDHALYRRRLGRWLRRCQHPGLQNVPGDVRLPGHPGRRLQRHASAAHRPGRPLLRNDQSGCLLQQQHHGVAERQPTSSASPRWRRRRRRRRWSRRRRSWCSSTGIARTCRSRR